MTAGPDETTLRQAVAYAVRAPSVWNCQPWRWQAGTSGGIDLFADRQRHQITTDPDGRDLLLSCGAALHHLTVALAALGWSAETTRLPNPENLEHLAHLQPQTAPPSQQTTRLTRAIGLRRTDRRRFSADPVGAEILDVLVKQAAACGAELHLVTAPPARQRLIEMIAEAGSLQRQQLGYAAEVARWTSRHAGAEDGIAPESTVAAGVDRAGDIPMRAVPHSYLTQTPHGLEHHDASVLMLLCTDHDDRLATLRAGEATSSVLLAATDLGLATTPLSQPLEVANTRAAIRHHIPDPRLHPQLVLRVGWAHPGAAQLPPHPAGTSTTSYY